MFKKERLIEVMEALSKGIDQEYLESPMFQHLVENSKYLDSPDNINPMILAPFHNCVRLAIQGTQNKKRDIVALWMNYNFIESNVAKICSDLFGFVCSVDRARFIVKSYIKNQEKGGPIPKLDWSKEYTYHYPPKGDMKEWFDLVEGIHLLKYGYYKKYVKELSNILSLKKEVKDDDKNIQRKSTN